MSKQEATDTVAQLQRKQSAVPEDFPLAPRGHFPGVNMGNLHPMHHSSSNGTECALNLKATAEYQKLKQQKREYKHYVKRLLIEAKELRNIIRK